MRYLMLAALVISIGTEAHAQAKRAVKAPAVKRAQDPDVIEAGAANFAGAVRFVWGDESQEVVAIKGCQMTIKSVRTSLGIVTVDEQTFDAGDAVGDVEPKEGPRAVDVVYYSSSKLTPWVTRKRVLYVDGAPRPATVERAVFLTLAVPNDVIASQGKAMIEAFRSYRAFCVRQ